MGLRYCLKNCFIFEFCKEINNKFLMSIGVSFGLEVEYMIEIYF